MGTMCASYSSAETVSVPTRRIAESEAGSVRSAGSRDRLWVIEHSTTTQSLRPDRGANGS